MSTADMARAGDAAYEAIRSLNHETISRTVPAPVAYDVLGSLQQVGFALDQLTRQLGAGLVRSLTTYDVYDDKGDPAASVALAVDALLLAGQHARRVGECLATAQSAISGQGHTGVKEDQR
ncbi:hypothetical protein EV643_121160 [Kribbella sp. VKM Ac-2527]|uniref:Excreted virulence factor EspC (Type VII ESX diderm) n=1 Tax=Kribbella caucasensis TaxID=2512215 RepID=A0A4R6JMN4_9ACTN|nr:hypothetical protein [Kribbella sp. VKM Ac-2527]TDO35885.1 hypothetical protein EV643_121160 [Kribbella sp. VKM Ac-2527]